MRRAAATVPAFLLLALSSGLVNLTAARSEQAPTTLGDGDSIFIDGTSFSITTGRAKSDPAAAIDISGARELGPGAIVFRSGGKLYIIDAPVRLPLVSAQPVAPFAGLETDRTNRVRIEYVPPENPEHQHVYDVLRERGMLENIQRLFSPFRLPVDLTVKTLGCNGLVNAWYERVESRPTVSICYEYVQHIMQNSAMENTPWGITRRDATCGQFLFVAAHEIGHAFFDIFKIPVLGREEDAADGLATYFMLQMGEQMARRLIAGAAYAYNDFIKGYKDNPKVLVPLRAFSSSHGNPEQRYFNLLCVAYGGRPTVFADAVEKGLLPETRARGCRYEFNTLRYAIVREIGPHLDWPASRQVWNLPPAEDLSLGSAP